MQTPAGSAISTCGEDQYIWYRPDDWASWYIGAIAAVVLEALTPSDPDEDLVHGPTCLVHNNLSEYVDGERQLNSAISVACSGHQWRRQSPNSNIRTAVAGLAPSGRDRRLEVTANGPTFPGLGPKVTDMSYLFCADTSSSSGLCNVARRLLTKT